MSLCDNIGFERRVKCRDITGSRARDGLGEDGEGFGNINGWEVLCYTLIKGVKFFANVK
jgi:hypothetical protein